MTKDMSVAQHPASEGVENRELTPHQRQIIDYALQGAVAANRVMTEETVTRVRNVVHNEIDGAFEKHNRMTTARKVILGVGAALAFGLGFLVRGWTSKDEGDEDMDNGVNE
jgi:hypothetical protein